MKLDKYCTCNNNNCNKPENYLYNSYNQPHYSHQQRTNDFNSFFANINNNYKNCSNLTYDPTLPPPPPTSFSPQTTATPVKSIFNQPPTLYSYTPTKQNTTSAASQFLYNPPERNIYHQVVDIENDDQNADEQLLIKIDPLATASSSGSRIQVEDQQQPKQPSHGISDEETRRLSGLVAKTRALFEAASNANNSTINRSSINKSISVNNLNNNINNRAGRNNNNNNNNNNGFLNAKTSSSFNNQNNRNLFQSTSVNKEFAHDFSNSQNQSDSPSSFLPQSNSFHSGSQLRHKSGMMVSDESASVPKKNLWVRTDDAVELNIPKSVKEARACFENLAMNQSSSINKFSSNSSSNSNSAVTSNGPNGSYSRLAKSQIMHHSGSNYSGVCVFLVLLLQFYFACSKFRGNVTIFFHHFLL
jgi:hypothetical protein